MTNQPRLTQDEIDLFNEMVENAYDEPEVIATVFLLQDGQEEKNLQLLTHLGAFAVKTLFEKGEMAEAGDLILNELLKQVGPDRIMNLNALVMKAR